MSNLKSNLAATIAAALLAACGAATPAASGGPPPTVLSSIQDASAHRSWIVPGAAKGDLLYVSSLWTHGVYIFSYPRLKLVGVLDHYYNWDQPSAICADHKGNVFVPMYAEHKTLEFAHGGTHPIASFALPNAYPYSCAVDPTTGNLAVSGGLNGGAYTGAAIYAPGKSQPTIYDDPYVSTPFTGYDNHGNLFLDGGPPTSHGVAPMSTFFALSELGKGATTFSRVTVNQTITAAGNVQWDGKYLTVLDSVAGVIYQLKIAGSVATVVGSTTLENSGTTYGSWIQGNHVIMPDQANAEVKLYSYPQGGQAVKSTVVQENFSATVSVDQKH